METNEIIMLIAIVAVGYFLLKFLWNMVGNLIKLSIVALIAIVATHYVKPELLGRFDPMVSKALYQGEVMIEKGITYFTDAVNDAASDAVNDAVTKVKEKV